MDNPAERISFRKDRHRCPHGIQNGQVVAYWYTGLLKYLVYHLGDGECWEAAECVFIHAP